MLKKRTLLKCQILMELLSLKSIGYNDSYAITNDALHKVNDSTIIKWNFNYVNELSKKK
jgi:hypothetical protein